MKSRIINVNFKPIEFDRFRNQTGLSSFALSARKWIDATGFILANMSMLTYTTSHE